MKRLGLTGSIGMGKSVAASQLRQLGIPVYDADAEVHRLYARGGGAVAVVAGLFPDAVVRGAVDRARLGALVFGDPGALRRLEAAVHPLLARGRDRFLRQARARRMALVVLDLPLLFETGGAALCDGVAVVSCPAFLQARRVLARPGMTAARLRAILARQVPDVEKWRRADFVVPSGNGRRSALRCWIEIVRAMRHARRRRRRE